VIEATGYQHAWRLRFDWFARREEAILGVSAGISQISNAPRPDGGESFCSLVGTDKLTNFELTKWGFDASEYQK